MRQKCFAFYWFTVQNSLPSDLYCASLSVYRRNCPPNAKKPFNPYDCYVSPQFKNNQGRGSAVTVDCADFKATYEATSITALSANPAVALPILTINGWILMQRRVNGSSVSFEQNWAEYRDGFGAPTGNDNYWLGLEKVYRLMQLGSVSLRIEVWQRKGDVFKVYRTTIASK